MRDCGHPVLITPHTTNGDTTQCPACLRMIRFDGNQQTWRLDTVTIELERELVDAMHREIVDDSTTNEALRTILVERGAVEELP